MLSSQPAKTIRVFIAPLRPMARTRARPTLSYAPYLALLFGIIGLGFSGLFVKWANAPGPVSGFYRVAIAGAILALPFGRELRSSEPVKRRYMWLAALAGVFFAFDLASWNTSVLITSVANSTLLANTSPIWASLGALFLFKERLSSRFWLGLLLIMSGAVFILGQDFLLHPTLGVGDMLALLAGFFYGSFFLATERARVGASPLVSWWISAAASTVVLLLISLALRMPLWGYSSFTLVNLLALALLTQVGGYLSINYALGHLPASLVSATLLGQPVLTAILAIPLLGQGLSLLQVLGGFAVLAGIALIHSKRRVKPNPLGGE